MTDAAIAPIQPAVDRFGDRQPRRADVLMVSKVTPRQVVARMVNGSSVSFVDARSEGHWSAADSKITGAVRAQLPSLVQDATRVSRSRLVVVYGHDGHDLEVPRIAEALRGIGFGEVRILSGGFSAWQELQFAVESARENAN
jgi:3-mercaptopyruvate sulfurtransferase SseA